MQPTACKSPAAKAPPVAAPNDEAMDKVVMMADYLRHHPGNATVPDPYYGGDKGFELVIELLEDACRQLYLEQVGDDHITNV